MLLYRGVSAVFLDFGEAALRDVHNVNSLSHTIMRLFQLEAGRVEVGVWTSTKSLQTIGSPAQPQQNSFKIKG